MIVGVDVGGTNVDAVAIESGQVVNSVKVPVDRDDLSESILSALKEVIGGNRAIERITLSTTHCTNAIVEGKTEPVAMILEPGPGIDPSAYFGEGYVKVSGYIDHRGTEIAPVSADDIKRAIAYAKDYEYVGIAGKFSVRNPNHENYIREKLGKGFKHITVGHELSGALNYPRRVNSVYLNSCVHRVYSRFVSSLKKALEDMDISCPVYVLKADGGTMEIQSSTKFPINTILSGPSASIMGVLALSDVNVDAVSIDIGGTTTDISFYVDGLPAYEPHGIEISGYKTHVKALYSRSIALGGDSAIQVKGNKLVIGPQRMDKAMALGGAYPTPTDAFNVLGLCNYGDTAKSYQGMMQLAQRMGEDAKKVAHRVYDMVCETIASEIKRSLAQLNERPVYTIRELLYGRKIQPQLLIAVGGPARALADKIAAILNVKPVVPDMYQVANSVGAALSRVTKEVTLLADTDKGYMVIPEMGIRERIQKGFDLSEARDVALNLLKDIGEAEVVEEQCFNMVRGFYTVGKNIRVKAAVKPGLII
ncbi:hydantoinase/oxoprolinase family protein [Caldanaerobius polysaccharolyticus]|uniref:hydantoinase/oxoprolinase family protein n=1 Tax=Caldanaerobius polysaccharolyticus TaxID=44256 RepID=UPI00047DE775|nr:hydantoinase/oxoprolinase family protein [Caldanaerobius polysaccharolyticus]